MKPVAVLFSRKDSIYKKLPSVEVYDKERDARTYRGGIPIVAHPPCRLWGRLRHFSTAPPEEKELSIWTVHQIRENGGVLEHPAASRLWPEMNLPAPGKGYDEFGGWTLGLLQWWFGHKAEKATKLYICGITPMDLPEIPIKLGYPEFVVSSSKRKHSLELPEISKRERQETPKQFAEWLIELARRTIVLPTS